MKIALISFRKRKTTLRIYSGLRLELRRKCNNSVTASKILANYCQAYKLGVKEKQSALIGFVGIFFLSKEENK